MRLSATLLSYLARRFIFGILVVFAVLITLALSIDLADLFSRTSEKNVAARIVIGMALLKLPDIGQKLLPFAVLFGAIWTFSRMSRAHELVAARAAGVSAWQFLVAPLGVAIGLGFLTMTLYSPAAAALLSQYSRLEARYIRGEPSQLAVSGTGLWLRQGEESHQSVIHALQVADQGAYLEDIIIFLYEGRDHFAGRIDARTGQLGDHVWNLSDAWVSGVDGRPAHHASYRLPTELTPVQIEERLASPDTISFWDLPRFVATAERAGFSAKRHRLHWYSLLALPLLYSAMVIMAASFSSRLVRLGRVPQLVLMAALSGFAVYFLQDVTEALGRAGNLPLALAAVAPAIAAMLLGVTLLFHEEDG